LDEFSNYSNDDYPRSATIHELFIKQSSITPDRVAVSFNNEIITYKQLNVLSNKLAWQLLEAGAVTERLFTICMERSLEMVVSIMAILKAGGAYVPLDPEYPKSRLQYMLADTKSPVLLTQNKLKGLLPEFKGRTIFPTINNIIESKYPENPPPSPTTNANSLAYIMYTSGSTGKPKGVEIMHRGVIRLVKNTNYVHLDKNEIFLQYAPISFDASTFEIWAPLLNGGKLVICPPGQLTPEELGSIIQKNKISTLWLTAALFHYIADNCLNTLQSIKQLLAGGDVLSPASVRKTLDNIEGIKLINGYGPTENTTFTCCFPMTHSTKIGQTVPIGRPITNTKVYILNKDLKPVPDGEIGELCTSGDGLAKGYLNQKEETSRSFVTNPFSNTQNDKLYKTGDLARYLPDGNIEFLGRKDHQVKIRGHRIETGEIAAIAAQHKEIKDSLVIARDDLPGGKCLILYYISDNDKITNLKLRKHCQNNLPDYMIPQYFVRLERFPLTPVGKIDRKALPSPEITEVSEEDFATPETETEKNLAESWQEVLGFEKIGLHDNFFHLGGHSLMAARMLAQIQKTYNIKVPFRQLFKKPTINALANYIDQQPNQKYPSKQSSIKPVTRDSSMPLASSQHLLWTLQQIFPDCSAYNIATTIEIAGGLHIPTLKKSIEIIIGRHEALRTIFPLTDGTPSQKVIETIAIDLKIITLNDLKYSPDNEELTIALHQEAAKPFNIAKIPPLRALLFRFNDNHHVLLLTVHHIVFDAWSRDLFLAELNEIYRAETELQIPVLPELPIQYIDYVCWHKKQLQTKELQAQLNFWCKSLEKAPVLQMPTDNPRPTRFNFIGKKIYKPLPPSLTTQLNKLANEEGVTLYMLLLSAWYVLLQRYSGQNDIVIGMPVSGRVSPELENLIGYFVNVLPLRITTEQSIPFTKLLAQVKEITLKALENQDIPTEHIIEKVAPPRSTDRTPLMQSFFVFVDSYEKTKKLGNTEIKFSPCDNGGTTTDISTWFYYSDSNCFLETEYSTDLFHEQTIIRLQNNFIALLENLYDNRTLSVSHLPLLSKNEQQQLQEWNQTENPYPENSPVHELIEKRAALVPEKTAIIDINTSLTFRQLNEQANRLARYLRNQGVTSNTFVGICVNRSANMITIILAILKAGGTYLPLDPDFPKERLLYMLEDTQAPLVITERNLLDRLPKGQTSFLLLDEIKDSLANYSTENLTSIKSQVEDLAYIIYTSGSTGKPKGVQVPHRALVNFLDSITKLPGFDENNKMLAVTTLSFDLSIPDVFFPPYIGATTYIANKDEILDGNRLTEVINSQNITILSTTPSTFRILQMYDWPGKDDLAVITIGEPFTDDLKEFLLPRTKEIWNLYGPTETTVWSTGCLIKSEETIHIGKPLSNTQIYILDETMQQTPIGVPGELYISGAGVTLGYRNRPELNQKHFLPNPFTKEKKYSTIYKTGDLVRYRSDGNIEFLGRRDNQVKVRGFRIELGEIENALNNCPTVNQAIVIVKPDSTGNNQLLAYLTINTDSLQTDLIRQELHKKLPNYMIPSLFIKLENFPMTANGKIDRKSLPMLETLPISEQNSYTAPETVTEKLIADLWQGILGIKKIGLNDNFFQLGGHSLLAVKFVSKLQKKTNFDLPLATLFNAPTIKNLAPKITISAATANTIDKEKTTNNSPWSSLVTIQAKGSRPPLFLIHAIGGNVLNYSVFPDYLGPEQPIYGLQARGLDGITEPFYDIQSMAKHYAAEIRTIQPQGPYFIGGGSFGGSVSLEIARQLRKEGQEIALLAMFDTYGPNSTEFQNERKPWYKRALHKTRKADLALIIKNIYNSLQNHSIDLLKNTVCHIFKSLSQPIPHSLRYWHITQLNYKMILDYQPAPYSGEVTLFQSNLTNDKISPEEMHGWAGIIRGEFTTIGITTNHMSFIEDREFGRKFSAHLQISQQKFSN